MGTHYTKVLGFTGRSALLHPKTFAVHTTVGSSGGPAGLL